MSQVDTGIKHHESCAIAFVLAVTKIQMGSWIFYGMLQIMICMQDKKE